MKKLGSLIKLPYFYCDIMTRKMIYIVDPKHDDDGNVIGCVIDLTFAENPNRSKGGTGPNFVDFTTGGNKLIDLEDGIAYKLGINLYHPA